MTRREAEVINRDQAARGLSRRRFLQCAALAGGATAAAQLAGGLGGPGAAALLRAIDPSSRTAVRLLSSESISASGLGHDLTGGLKLYWDRVAAGAVKGLHLAASVAGASTALEIPKVRQAIEQDRLGVVLSVVGAHMASQMRDIIRSSGTSLVVVDGGANVVRAGEGSPSLFYSTAGYWQSNWAMGAWAAKNLGRRAFLAASFYESGYDAVYAAEMGIEAARGQVVARQVNQGPNGPKPVTEMIAAIKSVRPDFVFAAYSGREAVAFVRAYAEAGLQNEIPLVGSGFLVDESRLLEMGSAAVGIHSTLSWAPTLATPDNQAFVLAYRQLTGRAPNVLAVVGYDTARWMSEALAAAGSGARRPEVMQEALLATRFTGPRGRWAVHPSTQYAVTPLYLRQVQARPGGAINQVLGELPPVDELDPRLAALRQATRTGWLYAYPSL